MVINEQVTGSITIYVCLNQGHEFITDVDS